MTEAKALEVIDKRATHEVEVVPAETTTSVVLMALLKGYTPELIEKMMDLQERNEANEARKAYHRDMAVFKANPPKIFRDLQVKYEVGNKSTSWSHSDLGVAADAINVALGENHLNATWRTDQLESKEVKVTCIIAHELGHSESTALQSPPDTTGSKNAIQAIGSTIFYLERYTLFAMTGLAPARMDDDGKGAGDPPEYVNDKQLGQIRDMILETKADTVKFLALYKAESDDKILAKDFGKAMTALKAKLKAQKKAADKP